MYSFYRQVHPPSGMEHNVYCNFMSTSEKNLVVAGVNYIHVYRLLRDIEAVNKTSGDKTGKKHKLELLGSFHLFGNVMSMQSVRLAGNVRDSLLISFRQAKLSIIDYDPSTHDLKTTSMHYFEEEELKGGRLQQAHHIPTVRVDPEGRAAAMIIFGTKMVILPFRRDQATDDTDPLGGPSTGSKKGSVMSSYIIDLGSLDEKITNVVDFQFLHGYYEPTIFILYEPLPTWAGRVAVRKDSCNIVAISLNIQEKVHPIIWSLAGLPYDCFYAQPVPKPIGGVLVFAINSLLYLNQSVPPYGVSLNCHTDFSTEFLLKIQDGVKMTLDTAQSCFISYDKLVISLKGGELYVLTLVVDGMRAVRSFHFDKAAASVITTCMCTLGDGFLFLGSRLGNSLLLKYTEKEHVKDISPKPTEGDADKDKDDSDEPPKKKKVPTATLR